MRRKVITLYHCSFLRNSERRKFLKIIEICRKKAVKGQCWLWPRALKGSGVNGYGLFTFVRRILKKNVVVHKKFRISAHRAAWLAGVGGVLKNEHVLHSCDNPPCVNFEDHLFLGTQGDNVKDMWLKGRNIGVGNGGACRKISKTKEKAIRKEYFSSDKSQHYLSVKYNLSDKTIGHIVRNKYCPKTKFRK